MCGMRQMPDKQQRRRGGGGVGVPLAFPAAFRPPSLDIAAFVLYTLSFCHLPFFFYIRMTAILFFRSLSARNTNRVCKTTRECITNSQKNVLGSLVFTWKNSYFMWNIKKFDYNFNKKFKNFNLLEILWKIVAK